MFLSLLNCGWHFYWNTMLGVELAMVPNTMCKYINSLKGMLMNWPSLVSVLQYSFYYFILFNKIPWLPHWWSDKNSFMLVGKCLERPQELVQLIGYPGALSHCVHIQRGFGCTSQKDHNVLPLTPTPEQGWLIPRVCLFAWVDQGWDDPSVNRLAVITLGCPRE